MSAPLQCDSSDCTTRLSNIHKKGKVYTCGVCCKWVSLQDTKLFTSAGGEHQYVCSKICAHTFSQTLAFVQGFILCKVLSTFINSHKKKSTVLPGGREDADSLLPEKPIKVEHSPELSDLLVVGMQDSKNSFHAEPISFQYHSLDPPARHDSSECPKNRTTTSQVGPKSLRHRRKVKDLKHSSASTHMRGRHARQDISIHSALRVRVKKDIKDKSGIPTSDSVHNIDKGSDLSCSECGKKFGTRKTMKAHLRIKHKKDISRNKVCRICGQGFSRQVGLSLHMANKHRGEKAVECETCGERFSSSTDYDRHMTLVHGKQRGVCHICGKHFKYLHTLQAHVRAHTGVRAFVCEICGKGFLRQTTLLDHKKRHFCKDCKKGLSQCECPQPKKKRIIVEANGAFQCRFCGEILRTFDLFEAHTAAHKMERPYGCSMCDKRFMDKTGLRAHMHQHREKRFQCDVCEKTFTYKCNLKHHRENHNVEGRPFPCNVCQKTFKTENALKVHKDVHFEERRVNCHICGKSLTRVNNLKRHLKVMHPESSAK